MTEGPRARRKVLEPDGDLSKQIRAVYDCMQPVHTTRHLKGCKRYQFDAIPSFNNKHNSMSYRTTDREYLEAAQAAQYRTEVGLSMN